MSFLLAALQMVLIFGFSASSSPRLDLNPALGKYQDMEQCFPLSESWVTLYRNYPWDPLFGGNATCIKETQTGPAVNGAYPLLSQFGDQSARGTLTFHSSEGYTIHNVLKLRPEEGNTSVDIYVAYADCQNCVILRKTYVNDNACGLLVAESQVDKDVTCCDFIFDLVCGTTPKYNLWDDSCRT